MRVGLRCGSHTLGGFLIVGLFEALAQHPGPMGVPHLSTDGLQFVALFGSEDREEGSFRLDPHESQVGFERFALFELGFDDGEARLLIRDDSPELPLRHQHVRVPPNLRPVLVKRQRLQLGNLLGGQADVVLMPEQTVKHAGRALWPPMPCRDIPNPWPPPLLQPLPPSAHASPDVNPKSTAPTAIPTNSLSPPFIPTSFVNKRPWRPARRRFHVVASHFKWLWMGKRLQGRKAKGLEPIATTQMNA